MLSERFRKLKENYDAFNKHVAKNPEAYVGIKFVFTKKLDHPYIEILSGYDLENENVGYFNLEGDERFTGCIRYWSNPATTWYKNGNVFTVHSVNPESGLVSFEECTTDLEYHSLFVFDEVQETE